MTHDDILFQTVLREFEQKTSHLDELVKTAETFRESPVRPTKGKPYPQDGNTIQRNTTRMVRFGFCNTWF